MKRRTQAEAPPRSTGDPRSRCGAALGSALRICLLRNWLHIQMRRLCVFSKLKLRGFRLNYRELIFFRSPAVRVDLHAKRLDVIRPIPQIEE